jgi:hypothetical protein
MQLDFQVKPFQLADIPQTDAFPKIYLSSHNASIVVFWLTIQLRMGGTQFKSTERLS